PTIVTESQYYVSSVITLEKRHDAHRAHDSYPTRRSSDLLASAIIPYLTVPFERSAERRGLLGESWRLREEQGRTAPEKVVGLALRRPLPAALIAVVAVAVVFSILLSLGPPTEWFA